MAGKKSNKKVSKKKTKVISTTVTTGPEVKKKISVYYSYHKMTHDLKNQLEELFGKDSRFRIIGWSDQELHIDYIQRQRRWWFDKTVCIAKVIKNVFYVYNPPPPRLYKLIKKTLLENYKEPIFVCNYIDKDTFGYVQEEWMKEKKEVKK